ncbi:class I SAM-dependent methyltransferase [uncultured Shewanella sp.]|uniref:class I SAM-dependent methyltransferase n=1 Tax=uncultured Shewanella sp. TaxID=173975 RepID=UPI00260FFFBC|nr:class I SAM-dependent methyltransferase [uncultured Shewanella sp.]
MDKYSITVNTFNKYAQKYQDKYMDMALYDDTFDLFCQHLNDKEKPALFEIGCGPGNISRFLLNQCPELTIHGSDLAPQMVELAKLNNPTATFEVMDCREIDRLDGSYDGIMCGFCLPYISKNDAAKLIADCAGLLRDKGIIYLSTMEGDEKDSGFDTNSNGDRVFTHYHRADYLSHFLIENGLKVIDIKRKVSLKGDGTENTDLFIVAQR